MSSPLIEEGLAALRDGDTATARRVLEVAVTEAESGEALEGLAEVLYLEREYAASAARYERAYTAYRRERERMGLPRKRPWPSAVPDRHERRRHSTDNSDLDGAARR